MRENFRQNCVVWHKLGSFEETFFFFLRLEQKCKRMRHEIKMGERGRAVNLRGLGLHLKDTGKAWANYCYSEIVLCSLGWPSNLRYDFLILPPVSNYLLFLRL